MNGVGVKVSVTTTVFHLFCRLASVWFKSLSSRNTRIPVFTGEVARGAFSTLLNFATVGLFIAGGVIGHGRSDTTRRNKTSFVIFLGITATSSILNFSGLGFIKIFVLLHFITHHRRNREEQI